MNTTAHISPPALVLGEHIVDADRIRRDFLDRNPDHPRREVIRKALANLPGTRRYTRPYEEVTDPGRTVTDRQAAVLADLTAAAERACRTALDRVGLAPADVDCVIVTSSTGDMMPGLDIRLQQLLPLRPDISRRPMTQLACAGGAHVLLMAEEHLARHPDAVVLVVAAESLSSLYQHTDDTVEDHIYKALWGDSAAAAVVTSRPLAPGLRIDHVLEYTIPDTVDRYRKETDERGDHFASTRASLRSVGDLAPTLTGWLEKHGATRLDFGVLHPGGPAILDRLGRVLGVDEAFLAHSRGVLTEEGNLGGVTVLSVLDRTHRTPPRHGDRGLLLGIGPGVTCGALLVGWHDPAAG
ncbi:PhlD [Kitasatospora sp. NPDC085879]|uniref:PhlD n=1 Tax=Kitasatospora sp. NPDC085879 TaxID=3154769 RepID=UPI003443E9C2